MRCRSLGIVAGIALATTSAPATACMLPQSLYFAHGSDAFTERSGQSLETLISWIQRNAQELQTITIVGHSDCTGSMAARSAISRKRAEAVRDRLIAYGVSASLLDIRARGDAEPAVVTPDGMSEPDNRRVEIIFTLTEAGAQALRERTASRGGAFTTCG